MTDNQQSADGEAPPQPGLRFLETTVYIMGGLLVLMLVVLLGGIAWKVSTRAPEEPAKPNLLELATPAGAEVRDIKIEGDRMTVHVVSGGAHEIIVVDTRKAQVMSRITLKPQAP
jgi:hypothetical protein